MTIPSLLFQMNRLMTYDPDFVIAEAVNWTETSTRLTVMIESMMSMQVDELNEMILAPVGMNLTMLEEQMQTMMKTMSNMSAEQLMK